jgi:hypothetical protein
VDCVVDGDVHWIGNISVPVSDNGAFGSSEGCSFGDHFSITFPQASHTRFGEIYLLVGGIREGDTLVSTSINTFSDLTGYAGELFPPCGGPGIRSITNRKDIAAIQNACTGISFDSSAVSDQDLIATYSDYSLQPSQLSVDPIDGRPHKPIGIEVTQRSYAWSLGNIDEFIIVDINVRNTGYVDRKSSSFIGSDLRGAFVGILIGADVRTVGNVESIGDEMIGMVQASSSTRHPSQRLQFDMCWVADNDGDGPGQLAASGALGIMPLPIWSSRHISSFNWWTLRRNHLDWGPTRRSSTVEFPLGGSGMPLGDIAKYQMLANGEFDYPSLQSAINHEAQGWSPPPSDGAMAVDIADGQAVQGLLGFGPFNVPLDSEFEVSFAIVGGESFHRGVAGSVVFDPSNPLAFETQLDFTGLLTNAEWASWVYDTPGVDTDDDGWSGEYYLSGDDTVYVTGDGIKDLITALPPPAPAPNATTRSGRIVLRWNGYSTETSEDLFTQRADFEGYRVYMSRTGREDEWSLLAVRDLVNYGRHTWNSVRGRWEMKDPPFTLDSLSRLYDMLTDTSYGFPFHPDSFQVPTLDRALLEMHFDADHPDRLDSFYHYFAPYEANRQADDIELALAAEAGVDVTGAIRKLYAQTSPGDTAHREDGTPYLPYYEYEYAVKGLQLAEPVFLSVTAFDHGDPASGLDPLESSKSINAREIWPINDAGVVKVERPKPGVYPNPYRLIDDYYGNNWENRKGLEPDRERARQVTFYNVPDTCTLSIWSLDGDLVRKIKHYADPVGSEATVVRWDLITRNTQAVKTGIYIWSIESRFGTDVGKLVIIK